MAVRAYLRSPAALVWTLVGSLAVGAVIGGGWVCVRAIEATAVGGNSLAAGGLAELLYLVVLLAVCAALAGVWLPVGAGIAYAVGRRVRGDGASVGESLTAVRAGGVALARWLKSRAMLPPVAERYGTENDVAPAEVAAGCEKFVVPAVVLDAPESLPRAVERANRVTPRPGHERLVAGGLTATGLLAAAAFFGGSTAAVPASTAAVATPLAAAAVVLGAVLTAALSTAWRASVYASADLSDGFNR